MERFAYARPKTLDLALALLADEAAAPLAGGTDLISLMKDGVETPAKLVSLADVADLRGVERFGDGWRIGAMTTLSELAANAAFVAEYAALEQAIDGLSSPQICNAGTVGGDLLQRPRCWYYRSGFGLLGRSGSESMVTQGDNRYHAILGAGPAYFVCPSSLAPALIGLGAKAEIRSANNSSVVPIADLFRVPENGQREHTLLPGEVLVAVRVPSGRDKRSATYEVRQRAALDWPLVAAAVVLDGESGAPASAEVVLGHVAPVPWPATEAAGLLVGKEPTAQSAAAAGVAATTGARPLSRNAYKVRLAQVAVQRAVLRAAGMEVP